MSRASDGGRPALIAIPAAEQRRDLPAAQPREGADRGDPMAAVDTLTSLGPDRAVGVWTCTEGGWPIDSKPETEIFVVLSGRMRLVEEGGRESCFGPGDAGVVPRGWRGRWEVLEDARKLWVTVD